MEYSDFHFIRPLWFLGLIILACALFILKRARIHQSGWQSVLPKHLSRVLIKDNTKGRPLSLLLPMIIGIIGITALAGPTWKKLPQPVYQVARGSVILMDLSYSMYATDLSPNRLTRARYKAVDILTHINEGEIGLVAYAGEAFTISPLTEDIKNIDLLLPALSPDIMPVRGSNPIDGLSLASEMLKNAGHIKGDIYWITDGIEHDDIADINAWSQQVDYTLNILGVGTQSGAPIKLTNGELLKDASGSIVVPKLKSGPLKTVAQHSGGTYTPISHNTNDIDHLLSNGLNTALSNELSEKKSDALGDQWEEMGPYLVFVILPLVLGYFRRGIVLVILPLCLLLTPSKSSYASTWDNLWKTSEQQAQEKFNQQRYSEAAQQFENPLWQGSALYKSGEYEQALEKFKQVDSAESLYNQGNSLAKMQKLDEAINAYDQALERNPALENAQKNKALIEALKQQQEQQNNDNSDSSDSSDKEENNNQKSEQQESDNQQGDGSSDQQNSEPQDNKQGNQQDKQNEKPNSSPEKKEPSDDAKDSDSASKQENKDSDKNSEKNEQADKSENNKNASQNNKSDDEAKESESALLKEGEVDKETAQKHQQILNKVTDDPYLLLRNKMRLEYQKRRQNQSRSGVQKQW